MTRVLWTLTASLTIVALLAAGASAQQKIKVNLQGGPLPSSLSWSGPAVAPTASLLKCPQSQRAIIDPIIAATMQLVKAEGGTRRYVDLSPLPAITTPSHIVVSAARAPKGSYAVRLDISHSILPVPDIVNSFYGCLSLRFGPSAAASSLGLLVPDAGLSGPTYSPALGFYVIL